MAPIIRVPSATPNPTVASGCAIRTSSDCSNACGPATSWSCMTSAPTTSRGCSMSSSRGLVSSTLVGPHGREWRTRVAASAVMLAMLAASALAQSSSSFIDLAPDLVSKIAGELTAGSSITLSFAGDQERVRAEVARLLAARGFRIADGGDAAAVGGGCESNLRERVCAASIVRGESRRVVIAMRALAASANAARDAVVAMELRPIYTQQAPLLDVAEANGQLLVLSPDAVSLVGDTGGSNVTGRTIASRAIK